jgi:hypothetical protein
MSDQERFPDSLDLRKHKGGFWRLITPFTYRSDLLGEIVVPEGFVTDLASVPWFARWYVSRDGNHTKSAVIHDYLYARASEADFPDTSRRTADRVFLEAMRVCTLRPTLARVLYSAVRIGGGSSFRV